MRFIRTFLLLAVLGATHFFASAFEPEKDIKVVLEKGAVILIAPKGAHLKKSFTEINLLSKPGAIHVGPLPKGDGTDETGEEVYHGTLRVPVSGKGLSGEVELEVQYQPCTEGEGGNCYPPTLRTLRVNASEIPQDKSGAKAPQAPVEPKTEGRAAVEAVHPAPVQAPVVEVKPQPAPGEPGRGPLLGLLLVFLAGIGASLTPCVYPMIPITMAIIGAKGGGKARGLLLALCLVFGMAVTYTVLGVVAAMSGASFGSFAQRPVFLVPVSILFAIFALSLFGAFEIDLPQGLKSRLQGEGPRKGLGGAFIMGLVLGPLAAPCVGPIVASVLLKIAQQGRVLAGALNLFVFAMGMGVLFLVVGTFSAGLPRSGEWLTRLKRLMGVIVLGFAAWNVRLLVPEWVNLGMWMVVLSVAAVVLGAFQRTEDEMGAGLLKALGIILMALGILLGVRTVEAGMDVHLFPHGASGASSERAVSLWVENDLESARGRAKAGHKLVLIDAYTSWCAQCKELDHKTWPDPKVMQWLQENTIAVRVDCEKGRPDLQKALGIASYPTVILQDAGGRELGRSFGFRSPESMLAWLRGTRG